MGGVDIRDIEQSREAVRPVGHGEPVGRVRRLARARRVPGDDREIGTERVELRPPHAGVDQEAVQEHEHRPGSGPSIRDGEPVDLSAKCGRHDASVPYELSGASPISTVTAPSTEIGGRSEYSLPSVTSSKTAHGVTVVAPLELYAHRSVGLPRQRKRARCPCCRGQEPGSCASVYTKLFGSIVTGSHSTSAPPVPRAGSRGEASMRHEPSPRVNVEDWLASGVASFAATAGGERPPQARRGCGGSESGAEGVRTPDLRDCQPSLSQLSYGPVARKSSRELVVLRPVDAGFWLLRGGHPQPDCRPCLNAIDRNVVAAIESME